MKNKIHLTNSDAAALDLINSDELPVLPDELEAAARHGFIETERDDVLSFVRPGFMICRGSSAKRKSELSYYAYQAEVDAEGNETGNYVGLERGEGGARLYLSIDAAFASCK